MKRRWAYYLTLLACVVLAGCGGNVSSGDRVLVSKYLYDTGLKDPQRWDVVVFRFPKAPISNGTPKNYIKRLLGLPGELLAILFGRIYRAQVPEGHPEDASVDPRKLWEKAYLHSHTLDPNEPAGSAYWQDHKFEILRKPLGTQLAMSRIVYDNDHPAADLQGILPPRWQGVGTTAWKADPNLWESVEATAWKADTSNGFNHSGQNAGKMDWLRYRHILRPDDWPQGSDPGYAQKVEEIKQKSHPPQLITDFLGYNEAAIQPAPEKGESLRPQVEDLKVYRPKEHNWVGDLMLECAVKVERAEGELCLELCRGVDRFQASWNLQTGDCSLFRLGADGRRSEPLGRKGTSLKAPGEYRLRFANVDARLTVWVNGDLPFGDGVTYAEARERGPQGNDLEPAGVGSKGAAVQVQHLKLWRDTYYTLQVQGSADAESPDRDKVEHADPKTWLPLRKLKYRTLYVQPGHYLCLGDNSPQSSDSRDWGTVPERLMLGRALMVYFPFDRAGRIR